MNRKKLVTIIVGIVMGVVFIQWITPIFFMFLNSFKPLKDVVINTAAFPKKLYLDNFVNVWQKTNYLVLLRNSIIITGGSTVGIILLSAMAGYRLGRSKGRFANIIIVYLLMALIVPFQAIMIPLVKVMNGLRLTDSIFGIILLYIALQSPLAIFLYNGAVQSIPISLEESAYMDGAGPFKTFFRIIFPLLRPITTTVVILNTLWIWNDFLLPLIMLQSANKKTIPLGTTAVFFGQYMNKWHWGITSIFLASLPMILLYLFLQKYIIKGVTEGSVKG